MLLTEGPLEEQARYMLTEPPDADQLPDETVLLPMGGGLSQAPYRRGIIGKRDRTLEPMIPPTSIVYIDTQNVQSQWGETGSMNFNGPYISS
jgi:hypothetical protein